MRSAISGLIFSSRSRLNNVVRSSRKHSVPTASGSVCCRESVVRPVKRKRGASAKRASVAAGPKRFDVNAKHWLRQRHEKRYLRLRRLSGEFPLQYSRNQSTTGVGGDSFEWTHFGICAWRSWLKARGQPNLPGRLKKCGLGSWVVPARRVVREKTHRDFHWWVSSDPTSPKVDFMHKIKFRMSGDDLHPATKLDIPGWAGKTRAARRRLSGICMASRALFRGCDLRR